MNPEKNRAYNDLIGKLDSFIRKYYTNLLLKGTLLFIGVSIGYFISAILLDYFFDYGTTGRTFLFFTLIGTLLIAGYFWIITPLLKIYRLGKIISYAQASLLVGEHFEAIKDKILNTLQLFEKSQSGENVDLLRAALDQRIMELKPVPFNNAINLKENRKYLRYALPPVLGLLVILLASPRFLSEGADRLFNYSEEIEKKASFEFNLQNKSLIVPENSDLLIELVLSGEQIPEVVFIETQGYEYRMDKTEKRRFSYLIKNIGKNQKFRFQADGFNSEEYEITTIPNPSLLNFEVSLDYPSYTGKSDSRVSNIGDITVPQGTIMKWYFTTKNTNEIEFVVNDSLVKLKPEMNQYFSFTTKAGQSFVYYVRSVNEHMKAKDSLAYYVNVIPDNHPAIGVSEQQDSTSRKLKYFIGDISDDYGLSKLTFNYRFVEGGDSIPSANELKSVLVPISKSVSADEFIYFWDMTGMRVMPGDQIEYYFTVWDNDGINGPKSTRSMARIFKAPTLEEIAENTASNNKEIKDEMNQAVKDVKKLQKDMKEMKTDLLNKKNMSWQDKAKMQNLLDQQKQLQNKMENLQKKNENNNFQKSEFTETDPEILEKQKQLEELFEQLMTDEIKKLYEELEQLLEQMNKDKVQEKLEEIEKSDELIKKELDRALEQFKEAEFQEKLTEVIEKMDKLAQEQKDLSEESKEKNVDKEALEKKQDELTKEFDKLKEDMREMEKMNEELEKEHNLEDTKSKEEEVSKEQKESKENLKQNQKKKASDSQKKAGDKMKEMADQMAAMQQQMQQESIELDIAALRALLENLISLSFDQEQLMADFSKLTPKDGKYVKLGQKQRKLKDDMRMIEDSINALAKRIPDPMFQSHVSHELELINQNMDDAIYNIGERKTTTVGMHQQQAMTSVNNLSLILSEMLDALNAENNSKSENEGDGQCNKPGGKGKPKDGKSGKDGQSGDKPGFKKGEGSSPESIRKMQESLAKQLEKLKKDLEDAKKQGKTPGGGKDGSDGKAGSGLSKELAETAAQQEALRRKLQDLANELNKQGNNFGNDFKKIADDMEKTEEDIVNKRITNETINRQQDIMTRLLESERAMREREFDEQRKSNEAKDEEISNSLQFLEYKRKKEKEVELLRTIPPALQPYYKNKVNDYFNLIR